MGEVLQGDVSTVRHPDGRVEILSAPPVTAITLEFLAAVDPAVVVVRGDRVALAGQIEYRVTGWDPLQRALLAERTGPWPAT